MASFDEVFQELSSRFLLNLPESEFSSFERIFVHLQQAHWYYLDHNMAGPNQIRMDLKSFCLQFFNRIEYLNRFREQFEESFSQFESYLFSIPVCGGILLNSAMTKCVLVRGSKGGWTFPRGKMNEGESRMDCAVREVQEEIGYSMLCDQNEFISKQIDNKLYTLFIDCNVPESAKFETNCVHEISEISWYPIENLPSHASNNQDKKSFYHVFPFIHALRRWIKDKTRSVSARASSARKPKRDISPFCHIDSETNVGRSKSQNVSRSLTNSPVTVKSNKFDHRNADTFGNNAPRFTAEEMFAANKKLPPVAPEEFKPCRFMVISDNKSMNSSPAALTTQVPIDISPNPHRSKSASFKKPPKPNSDASISRRLFDAESVSATPSKEPVTANSSFEKSIPPISVPVASGINFQFRIDEILNPQ